MARMLDENIIIDISERLDGESNKQTAMVTVLKAILIELRILNRRSADGADNETRQGAEQALRRLSNFRT
jgi:hypothetical protein